MDNRNEVDIVCLHWVFFKLIEEELEEFIAYYNLHGVRTENMRPPAQLFHSGLQKLIERSENEGITFPELQQVYSY